MQHSSDLRRIKRIHFVGIGGSGMSGIAEVLLNEGYQISGSDLSLTDTIARLQQLGAQVVQGHDAAQLVGVDVVVVSTAIPPDNPECVAARAQRIPIISRAEMLAELMRFRYGIAVAGTHGKTTTTSLIASLLAQGGCDPTFVIGGLLNSAKSHARLGRGKYLVAEADESDASFLYLKSMITVVTNIDADHLGTYAGNFDTLKSTFVEFLHHLPFYGLAVMCIDDPVVRELLPQVSRPMITYGFSEDADVRARDFKQHGLCSHFTIDRKGLPSLAIQLNLPGYHNALNALAAICVAMECHVEDLDIVEALAHFQGIGRRFQIFDPLQIEGAQVQLIDDYGHHPREVDAVIDTVRAVWPGRRMVMAYQPHRYTRTKDLFHEFVDVLSKVDELVLLDVYSAGEAPIQGADSQALAQAITQKSPLTLSCIPTPQALIQNISEKLRNDDILVLQGAGSIGLVAPGLVQTYSLTAER